MPGRMHLAEPANAPAQNKHQQPNSPTNKSTDKSTHFVHPHAQHRPLLTPLPASSALFINIFCSVFTAAFYEYVYLQLPIISKLLLIPCIERIESIRIAFYAYC